MHEKDPLGELPSLGPAEERKHRAANVAAGNQRATGKSGGGWGVSLLLLIAVGGLGYWSYTQQQQLSAQLTDTQARLQQAGQRLGQLEGLLSASQMTTSESGQKLQSTLSQVKLGQEYITEQQQQLLNQYQQWQRSLESQVQDLVTQVQSITNHQGDQDRSLDAQSERISAQSSQFDALSQRLDLLDKGRGEVLDRLTTVESTVADVQSKLGTQLALLDKQLQDMQTRVDHNSTATGQLSSTQVAELNELKQAQDNLSASIASLKSDLVSQGKQLASQQQALKGAQRSTSSQDSDIRLSAMEERISQTEDAIRSIDSFRQQINQRLVRIEDLVKRR